MILQRYLSLLFLFQISLFAQTRLETEINRIKDIPGITLEYLEGDRLSVNYDGIKTRVFYIGDKESPNTTHKDVPSFVFNISELDTSLFNHRYSFWQEVPVASSFLDPMVGDLDNDGRAEIYGRKKDYFTDFSEVWCYEQDEHGIFKPTYKYAYNTRFGLGIYDVNRNGSNELHLLAIHRDSVSGYDVHDQTFFKSPSPNTLATEIYFDYNIYTGDGIYIQLNDFTVGDFNNDNINEAIFFNFAPQEIWMTKFNEQELTFDSLLAYPIVDNDDVEGFVIGDFDLDTKTDIIYSGGNGNIFILENGEGDEYSINWEGNNGIWASYINFKTDDIDKNGKPEFWIGGQNIQQGVTKINCYEYNSDNSYQPVSEISLQGLASLNGLSGMSIDVDSDSTEDFFINVGNVCLIIKFTGSPNNHNYEIYYYYKADNPVQYAKMIELPSDDRPSFIMSMYEINNGNRRDFSQIFKHNLTTGVKTTEDNTLNDYELLNNYPNPFNPTTTISFSIPKRSKINIIVYNSLGEEIITLNKNTLEKGKHKIVWNGTDESNKSVPSGVYFISLIANFDDSGRTIKKTIKSVLLK